MSFLYDAALCAQWNGITVIDFLNMPAKDQTLMYAIYLTNTQAKGAMDFQRRIGL